MGLLPAHHAPQQRRVQRGWTVEHAFLALLLVLLVGLLNVAHMAGVLAVPSVPTVSTATLLRPPIKQPHEETALIFDPQNPSGRGVRVGMAMPARGPPRYRPGCAYMAPHHLEDRFVRDEACYSREQMLDIIEKLVIHAAEVFEAHTITYFLESGTLLGAYRNGGVIPHDTDGDLAIDQAGYEYLRDHLLPFASQYQMDVWNSSFYENAGRDAKLSARLIHKESALYVDIFVFHDQVDRRTGRAMVGPTPSSCYYNCVKCKRLMDGRVQLQVPREWVYPLKDCAFGGKKLKCPGQTVEYLIHQYGEDFMEPA